jgi:hypothetical protein
MSALGYRTFSRITSNRGAMDKMDFKKALVHFGGTLQEKLELVVSELKNYNQVYKNDTRINSYLSGLHTVYEAILEIERYNSDPPKVRVIEVPGKISIEHLLSIVTSSVYLQLAHEKLHEGDQVLRPGFNSTVSLMRQIEDLILKARFAFSNRYYEEKYYEEHIKGPVIKCIQNRERYLQLESLNNAHREIYHSQVLEYDGQILPQMQEHFRYFWSNNKSK